MIQLCGHPDSAIVSGGDGTNYCGECAMIAQLRADARVLAAEVGAWRSPDHDAEPRDESDAAMFYAQDQRAMADNELAQARDATDASGALGRHSK